MRIETVLCPVDFTPFSQRHLQLAISVCRRFGARLVVEHNVTGSPPYFMGVSWMWTEGHEIPDQGQAEEAGDRLKKLLSELPGDIHPTGKLSRGPLDVALLVAAEEEKADLIVIGCTGPSNVDHHSLTEELIARAPCPVLGVNESSAGTTLFEVGRADREHPARVVVPVDLSEESLFTVKQCLVLAEELGLKMTFLHIAPVKQASTGSEASIRSAARRQAEMEERIEALMPDRSPEHACITIPGQPAGEIVQMASETEADLIVMGGHHAGVFRHLFSKPTSCEVLHACACPVLFIPPRCQGLRTGERRMAEAAAAR